MHQVTPPTPSCRRDAQTSSRRPRGAGSRGFSHLPWAASLIALLAPATHPVHAGDCSPDSIMLASQGDVDDFQANHGPDCDTVVGTLTISGANITNLDGLSDLMAVDWLEITSNPLLTSTDGLASFNTITGPVFIENNPMLEDVDGFSGISTLPYVSLTSNASLSDLSGWSGVVSTGPLNIFFNDSLEDLDDLANLSTVTQVLNIVGNGSLTSISGLANLSGYSGTLVLRNNPMLGSLDGLSGLTQLDGLIIDNNDSLQGVDELTGLTTIGNIYSSLFITDNDILANLNGLADLVSLNADVEIFDNPMLGECWALATLLDAVDDDLPGPGPGLAGIPDVAGDVVTLSGNAGACNSVDDIIEQLRFMDGFESGDTSRWSSAVP